MSDQNDSKTRKRRQAAAKRIAGYQTPTLKHNGGGPDTCPACAAMVALADTLDAALNNASGLTAADRIDTLSKTLGITMGSQAAGNGMPEVIFKEAALRTLEDVMGTALHVYANLTAHLDANAAAHDEVSAEVESVRTDAAWTSGAGIVDRRKNPALAPTDPRNLHRRFDDLPTMEREINAALKSLLRGNGGNGTVH